MSECVHCRGEKVSSSCIIWEGKENDYESFNAIIEKLLESTGKEPETVDVKNLSSDIKGKVSLKEALEVLIQTEVVKRTADNKATTPTTTQTCTLDISSLDNCSSCSKSECEKLQFLVSEIVKLKAEIEQLKTQI